MAYEIHLDYHPTKITTRKMKAALLLIVIALMTFLMSAESEKTGDLTEPEPSEESEALGSRIKRGTMYIGMKAQIALL